MPFGVTCVSDYGDSLDISLTTVITSRPEGGCGTVQLEARCGRDRAGSSAGREAPADGNDAAVLSAHVCRLGRWRRRGLLSVRAGSGAERARRACTGAGRLARSDHGSEVPDTAAHPPGDAEGRRDRPAGSDGRLLRDLDEAVRAADPACRSAREDSLGLRCCEVGEPERLA